LEDEIAARQARDLAVIKFSAKHWLGVALSAALKASRRMARTRRSAAQLEDEIAARQARDLAVIKFSAKHWLGVALSAAL
ncbi:hypothetical protein CTI14_68290, partial [Methylobacterium radiotolerans]